MLVRYTISMHKINLSLRGKLLSLILVMLFATAFPLILIDLDYLWETQVDKAENYINKALDTIAIECKEMHAKNIFMKAASMEVAKKAIENTATAFEMITLQEMKSKSLEEITRLLNEHSETSFFIIKKDGSHIGQPVGIASHDVLGVRLEDILAQRHYVGDCSFYVFNDGELHLAHISPLAMDGITLVTTTPLSTLENKLQTDFEAMKRSLANKVSNTRKYEFGSVDLLTVNADGTLADHPGYSRHELGLLQATLAKNETYLYLPEREDEIDLCYLKNIPLVNLVAVARGSSQKFLDYIYPLATKQIIFLLFLFLFAASITSLLALRLFSPLKQLTQLATILPKQDYTKPVDLNISLPVERRDEIGDLARSLSLFTKLLHENVSNVISMTAQRERLTQELKIAAKIQASLLPDKDCLNFRNEIGIASRIQPEKEVGGDLYDYFMLDEHSLCLTVGDVSGHGVPAALFMSLCITLLRGLARDCREPEKVVESANQTLSRQNSQDMFVSLFFGIYDIRDGSLSFCLAGHPPPIIIRAADRTCHLCKTDSPDLVTGLMEDISYQSHSARLEPGDTLFLYTDGISEAADNDGNFFGEDGMIRTLEQCHGQDAEKMANAILAAVDKFTNGAEPNDDRTILVLQRKGAEA